jgi:hypothetical protein
MKAGGTRMRKEAGRKSIKTEHEHDECACDLVQAREQKEEGKELVIEGASMVVTV